MQLKLGTLIVAAILSIWIALTAVLNLFPAAIEAEAIGPLRAPDQTFAHNFGVVRDNDEHFLEHTFVIPLTAICPSPPAKQGQLKQYKVSRITNPKPCCIQHQVSLNNKVVPPELRVRLGFRIQGTNLVNWGIRIYPEDPTMSVLDFEGSATIVPSVGWLSEIPDLAAPLAVLATRRISADLVLHAKPADLPPPTPVISVEGTELSIVSVGPQRFIDPPEIAPLRRWISPVTLQFGPSSIAGPKCAALTIAWGLQPTKVRTLVEWVADSPPHASPSPLLFRGANACAKTVVVDSSDSPFMILAISAPPGFDVNLAGQYGVNASRHAFTVAPRPTPREPLGGEKAAVGVALITTSVGDLRIALCHFR